MAEKSHRNSLKPGYRIGSYEILDILGQGGFGITYLAMDLNLNRKVAIKEYLPVELAVRDEHTSVHPVSSEHSEQYDWGLERFIREAQVLARFRHPNIVSVLTVLKENNTAYIVMDYEHGYPFSELLKGKKTLAEKQLKDLLFPILNGLESVHNSGFIHRDIKPPNIYIREDHSPVLIDFGSARQSLLEHARTLTTMVSPGFAPFEQYVGKSDKQGPWTDIYGLGATLYRAVTGFSPADALERSEALLHTDRDIYVTATEIAGDKYTPAFLTAIDQAMAFKAEDRPQSITEWRSIFAGDKPANVTFRLESEAATIDADVRTEKINLVEKPGPSGNLVDKLNRIIWKSVGWGLVLIIILFIYRMLPLGNRQDADQNKPAQVATTENLPRSASDKSPVNTKPVAEAPQSIRQKKPAARNIPDEKPESAAQEPRASITPVTANKSNTDTDNISRIPIEHQQKLQSIRTRLKNNPGDKKARQELNALSQTFEQNIVQAVNDGKYDLAKAYLSEVQKNADKTSQAYKKLEELMRVINKMEKQSKK